VSTGATDTTPDETTLSARRWTRRIRTLPWYAVPLAIFVVTRVVDAALISLVSRDQYVRVPAGSGPGGRPALLSGTSYFDMIANWDGQWYRTIVEHGYPSHLPVVDGVVQQNPWAYYPLYPMLVRLLTATGLSFGVAASLVSMGCGGVAMCLLYRMLSSTAGRVSACITVVALCTFPAAITFQTAYTESLALLLILASLWCLKEQRYGRLVIVASLLALTRPIVLPLALVVAMQGIARWRHRSEEPFELRDRVVVGLTAVGVALTFAIWPAIAGVVTGSPGAYFATQRDWLDSGPGPSWTSWLGFLYGERGVAASVFVVLVVLALALLVARPQARLWGQELRSWALAYPLYLLASTRATSSVFRYAMLAVVPWWPFPEAGRHLASRRARWGLVLVVATLGFCSQLLWLRWYFVIGPRSFTYP
jgi:hypothetical protein